MTYVRDSDTSLWLHNKLGSNEPWTSGSITSQLSVEVLRNIKECFIDLQTQVKLKLLLSFFHIPRRNIEEWKLELEEILEVAQADSEQWVSMLAEILKSFPTTNCLHIDITEPEENKRIFYDLAEEVTKEMKKNMLNLLPIECHYLNRTALNTVVAPQPIVKHFNVINNKSKSFLFREELMFRATDAAKHTMKKIPAPTVPLRTRGMPRKMTDTTPLKGIPSIPSGGRVGSTPTSLSSQRASARPGEKKGGIKVLDINEQPVGFGQTKRRRKATENEDFKKQGQAEDGINSEAPDYAVGLPSSVRVPTPPPPTPLTVPQTFQSTPPGLASPTSTISNSNSIQRQIVSSNESSNSPTKKDDKLDHSSTNQQSVISSPIQFSPRSRVIVEHVGEKKPSQIVPQPSQPTTIVTPPQMTKTVILQVPNHQPNNFVTLSKELMEKAQAIFITANRATRPEKEHILKFMAGTRDNPCPELGNIVTIKLSEREELHQQRDGTFINAIVETHFQMNYNTGEWKVITKPPKFMT